jgi:hypothetical protein
MTNYPALDHRKKCLVFAFVTLPLLSSTLVAAMADNEVICDFGLPQANNEFSDLAQHFSAWRVSGFEQKVLPPSGTPIPAIRLVPINEYADGALPISTKKVSTKYLVPGQRQPIVLRFFMHSKCLDVLAIIEGSRGVLAAEHDSFLVQSVFPYENIISSTFGEIFDSAVKEGAMPLGMDKPESETRHTFGRGPGYNFEKDLRALSSDRTWRALPAHKIRDGYQIPSQDGRSDSSWSCGPNSGARALQMLDITVVNYDGFVAGCPRTWFFGFIGPTVGQLSNYIDTSLSSFEPRPLYTEDFDFVLNEIVDGINLGRPSVISIERNLTSAHYVTLVGYNVVLQRVAILDTDRVLYWMTVDELWFWMNWSGHIIQWVTDMDDFNMIRFFDR